MSELWLIKSGNALHPADDESVSEFSRLPFSKPLRCEVKQPRNPSHHRLFFAMCHRIAGGIGVGSEAIAHVFKMATGHYDPIHTKIYGVVKVPKSISFAAMDQTAFNAFFEKCLEVAFTQWGIDRDAFADLLDVKTEKRA